MCRLFALRATGPLQVAASLAEGANSLSVQSRHDARGQSHVDGWGLAWHDEAGQPRIEKSLRPAYDDPRFDELAKTVAAASLVAHVRQASVGSVSLANTHPFVHGRWVFAHNGTLQDFSARRGPLLRAIPDDLRPLIQGDTDSEHVFYFWLGKLRAATGSLDSPVGVEAVTTTLQQTVRELDAWFPAHGGEESKFNFVATDGRLLAATRWKHRLSCLEHRGGATSVVDDSAVRAFAEEHGLEFVDLNEVFIPRYVVELIPQSIVRENAVLPMSEERGALKIIASDPLDLDLFERLRFVLNRKIEIAVAPRDAILEAINRHYGPIEDLSRDFRAVLIASEPTAGDGWREVPDRSLIVVDEQLEIHAAVIA